MMELLLMDADELKNPEIFNEALELVGESRRSRIHKMRKDESKRLSLAAGLLLRYAFFSVKEPSLYSKVEVTPQGKPYLPNNEYFFSLSHSGKFTLCGFSNEPMGCDIEKYREDIPPGIKKIFSSNEELTFQTLEKEKQITYFFQLWTCKESVTKWIGKGIAYPFQSFTVMDVENLRNFIMIERKKLFLKSFQIDNYAISLCAETMEFPQEIKKLEWNKLKCDN